MTVDNIMSVTRYPVSITPHGPLLKIDYKVQGLTCEDVTLDLHRQNSSSSSCNYIKDIAHLFLCAVDKSARYNLSLFQPATPNDFKISRINF